MEDIKVVINNRNRLTTTKNLVEHLLRLNPEEKIIIIDNKSTYQPLLDWYKQVENKVRVIYEDNHGHLAVWSIRLIKELCYATIGVIGNLDHKNEKLGKAGRKRHMGIKPTVRGTAQSGGKHPHGDGQGKSGRHGPGGPSKDPWGNRTGTRTRKNKLTNKYIIKRRSTVRGNKFKSFKTII